MWSFSVFDWRTARYLGDVEYLSATIDVALSRPGRLDLSVSAGSWSWPEPENRTLIVARRDEWMAVWIVLSSHRQEDTVQLVGVGPAGYFARRAIRTTKTYTATDQLAIVEDLLDSFGAADARVQVVTRGASVSRDRTYDAADRKAVLDAVTQLAECDGGFEWIESCVDGPTMQIVFVHPKVGSVLPMVWDRDAGDVEIVSWLRDGGEYVQTVDAIGGAEIKTATNPDPAMPAWDAQITEPDVTVAATLQAHADGELARRQTVAIGGQVQVLNMARFGPGRWNVGDQVRVVAASDGWGIDAEVRISGWSARIDDGETITVDVSDVAGVGRSTVPLARRQAARDADVARRLRALERI